jgi:hypothetical protein
MGVAMRASFDALRRRIGLPIQANSQQRKLLARTIFLAVSVVAIIDFVLWPDFETPEIADRVILSDDAAGFGPSFGSDLAANNPADSILAEQSLGNAERRAMLEAVAPKGSRLNASNDAMATGPKEAAVMRQQIGPPLREIAPPSHERARPIESNLFGNTAPNSSNFDGAPSAAAEQKTTPTSISAGERARAIAAIRRAKLIEDRQEWRYCLAPSFAEGKVYLSSPVPSSAISESAEAVFERTLKKDNIAHDEVQCPKAPNRPTLLFRQRYAVRWNQDNGTTVVTLAWRPDDERADKERAASRPLTISINGATVR